MYFLYNGNSISNNNNGMNIYVTHAGRSLVCQRF